MNNQNTIKIFNIVKIFVHLISLFSVLTCFCNSNTILVKLQYKAKLKSSIDYDELSRFNPDILKFDILSGDYCDSVSKFSLAIFNENRNNKYNEIGKDFIIIGNYGDRSFFIGPSISCKKIQQNEIIESNGQHFLVKKIRSDGKFIELIKLDKKSTPSLIHVWKLPLINLKLLTGDSISTMELIKKKKLIYIYFWATWCVLCHGQTPYLIESQDKWKEKVIFVGINGDENLSKANEYLINNNLTGIQAYFNLEFAQKIRFPNGFPYYVLFDEQGQVVEFNVAPLQIGNFIPK